MARNTGLVASLYALGRVALDHACWSAVAARYRPRPPWAATSRLTDYAERPSPTAIARSDLPAARPREISSRSSKLNRPGDRRRRVGTDPATPQQIRPNRAGRQPQLPSSGLGPMPSRNRTQISSTSAADNLR